MRYRDKFLESIFSAVEHLETIEFLGDMHVLTLTLWCTTIRINLSLPPTLLVNPLPCLYMKHGFIYSLIANPCSTPDQKAHLTVNAQPTRMSF